MDEEPPDYRAYKIKKLKSMSLWKSAIWFARRTILFRKCPVTGAILWPFMKVYCGRIIWPGPGEPAIEELWLSNKGFVIEKLKGTI